MNDDKVERRPDGLRNVAVASILEVTSEFMYVDDLDKLLKTIAKTVSETFGLAKVHIAIREEETGLFVVRAAHGFDRAAEEQIMKVKYTQERMERDLKPERKISRTAYYVPGEDWEPDDEDMAFVAHPERMDRARLLPNDWHECDFIDFMLHSRDGKLIGYLEIDEPDDQKVPSEETLNAIEVFSDLVSIAIQNSQIYGKLGDERRKTELLLDLISHDVNNYAQGVSGFIELAMHRPDLPPPARKSLAKAHDQALNLNKLVRNVKLYAKVESAGNEDIRPMDVVETVKDAFSAVKSSCSNKQVTMNLKDDGVRKLAIMNDLAKDIFLNIFSNAVKFDDHEEVLIDVGVDEVTEDRRRYWKVFVADHGPGIDDSFKNAVFERFKQGPATSTGTGLGLHIAKALVENYKGRIWVENRVQGDSSKGSVFNVLLPKSDGPAQVG